jgi:hypothetical protein
MGRMSRRPALTIFWGVTTAVDGSSNHPGRKMLKNRLNSLILLVLPLVCSLSACAFERTFYEKGSGWDYLRFPLIEPYYAIYVESNNNDIGWSIPLNERPSSRNFRYYSAIVDVRKVAVENEVIMVYTPYSKPIMLASEDLEEKELHWFILIPGQAELGFETEAEFLDRLNDYGIDQPKWQEPKPILQKFDQTGCLELIPGCE